MDGRSKLSTTLADAQELAALTKQQERAFVHAHINTLVNRNGHDTNDANDNPAGRAELDTANRTLTKRPAFNAPKVLYRLYTQFLPRVDVAAFVGRYFAGATITRALGLDTRTQDRGEEAIVIEVVTSVHDGLQRALDLAGDLRVAGHQTSVLVTKQDVTTFEVTADWAQTEDRVATGQSPRYVAGSKAQAHRLDGFGL